MTAEAQPPGKPNPLIRPSVRKTAMAGLGGLVITASTLLGAGTASAETLVVDDPLAVVTAQPGQEIAIDPAALDSKVHNAVLLAMPLASEEADRATAEFEAQPPIMLGTATEGTSLYSGSEIAEAAKPTLANIGLPEDKVEDVTFHFSNLVALGNGVTVHVAEPAPSPEPEPAPEQPAPEPEPPETPAPQPPSPEPTPEQPAPGPGPVESQEVAPPPANTPAPVPEAPTDFSTLGGTPPWSTAQFSEHPRVLADTLPQLGAPAPAPAPVPAPAPAPEQPRDEVENVGRAEAVHFDHQNRDVLPVLIAAIALSAIIAATIRGWVLRRD